MNISDLDLVHDQNCMLALAASVGSASRVRSTSWFEHAFSLHDVIPDISQVRTYYTIVLITICIISVVLWRRGTWVFLKVSIFLGALSTMKGVVKIVQNTYSFKYPLFLTGLHFACSSAVAFCALYYTSVSTRKRMAVPTSRHVLTRFLPIALAFAVSVVMCNIALLYSTTALVEILSAASPIVSVLLMVVMQKPVHLVLIGPCLVVFLGCSLCSQTDPTFSLIGLLLAGGANLPRSLKGVLQQTLMQKDESNINYSPLEVVAWTCAPSTLIMLGCSLAYEGVGPYVALVPKQRTQWRLFGAILISCANACVLNTANLFVVKDLGAVGAQLVAQTKSVFVIVGGVIVLGEQVPTLELVGFALVMAGVYVYNDLEYRLNHAGLDEQRLSLTSDTKQ